MIKKLPLFPVIAKDVAPITPEERDAVGQAMGRGFEDWDGLSMAKGLMMDEFGHEVELSKRYNIVHRMNRVLYGLDYSGLSKARREEIRRRLWELNSLDDEIFNEAEALAAAIGVEMSGKTRPKTEQGLLDRLTSKHLSKGKYVERAKDARVGKIGATWGEFKDSYGVMMPKAL